MFFSTLCFADFSLHIRHWSWKTVFLGSTWSIKVSMLAFLYVMIAVAVYECSLKDVNSLMVALYGQLLYTRKSTNFLCSSWPTGYVAAYLAKSCDAPKAPNPCSPCTYEDSTSRNKSMPVSHTIQEARDTRPGSCWIQQRDDIVWIWAGVFFGG